MGLEGQMSIKGADAQIISENFFDMPGQMYGLVTGDMQVSCKGTNNVEIVQKHGYVPIYNCGLGVYTFN